MKNTISASEVNKFLYCPYQWYYEKIYGRAKLVELKGTSGGEYTPFKKGNEFHKLYHRKYKRMQRNIRLAAIIFFVGVLVWMLLR